MLSDRFLITEGLAEFYYREPKAVVVVAPVVEDWCVIWNSQEVFEGFLIREGIAEGLGMEDVVRLFERIRGKAFYRSQVLDIVKSR